MDTSSIETLKARFSGELILPDSDRYEAVRSSMFSEGKPALVVLPKTLADIQAAIAFAKENSLVISVRSGGHSPAGFATNEGGIVIDMTNFNSVEILDQDTHLVRIGTGGRWGEVAKKLGEHGLAISSGDTNTVGVGGLTLGGGIGWMVRKYGLAIDSVKAVELVTESGDKVRASETENPELFWALRGGGGNFGVATHFEFQAQSVDNVYFGTLFFGLENLETLIKGWRDYMRSADENLTTTINIIPSFGGNPPGVMLTCCWANADKETAKAALDPLRNLGKVTMDTVMEKPYTGVLEEAHQPQGVKILTHGTFVKELSDDLITAIVKAQKLAQMFILQVRSLGGAMNRIEPDATAFAHRTSEILLVHPIFVPLAATEDMIEIMLKPWKSLEVFGTGSYSGFVSSADQKTLEEVYPGTIYSRLAAVKKQYDPSNIFNQNFNINPEESPGDSN